VLKLKEFKVSQVYDASQA